MTPVGYTEDSLVEKPAIDEFAALGWAVMDCYNEFEVPGGSPLGREEKGDVILVSHLLPALQQLNPDLPAEALQEAIESLTEGRSAMSLEKANQDVYDLIKDGVRVTLRSEDDGGETIETVRIIDWDNPENNDFLLCAQMWITGENYTRRPDLIGFVNGIPLVLVELKAPHVDITHAYTGNLKDYKDTIPQLFWYNAVIILSNGIDSLVGSMTSEWEHFAEWKKISDEEEAGVVSLETMIRGVCEKRRLLDIVENFTLFQAIRGGTAKIVAKNHQYLGVTNAIEKVRDIRHQKGRLGVFWHTQGSGKSMSMIFFAQKVMRKLTGNWTFVIVTDRLELDDQIYRNFQAAGVVGEKETHAKSGAHLRELLKEDHRYIFTIIHKFRTDNGPHPVLSERDDIIVITDEAHRSQYDTLAMNMRTALPNASFIAFTGTPLIVGEERTREVFGDYVSVYNFRQSIEDNATVPLFYENRIPEMEVGNENLNEDMERLLEEAELNDEQEKKLEREFAREYHIITREDRLDTVARDIVQHFVGRGFKGKGMVVCIDKATAVKMYDKVHRYWELELSSQTARMNAAKDEEYVRKSELVSYMKETDMAVVVSQGQNEIAEMKEKGVDIAQHRKRMNDEDLATKFKDPDDPLRLVFVCAMWMTGFDVPSCSTIYLDKPMRNHTLMQTIARANRVWGEKKSGIIVDYVGVFRNLEKALAVYGGGPKGGDRPIKDKDALYQDLLAGIERVETFTADRGFDIYEVVRAEGMAKLPLLKSATEMLLASDDTKKEYYTLSGDLRLIFKSFLPDPRANDVAPVVGAILEIRKMMRMESGEVDERDITDVLRSIEELLDHSISPKGFTIPGVAEGDEPKRVDLSGIDFDTLREKFEKGKKNTMTTRLRNAIDRTLGVMVKQNQERMDYLKRFEELVAEYNAGSRNVEDFFAELMKLAQALQEEKQRHVREDLSEEELAIYDLLIKPEVKLTATDKKKIKAAVRDMLALLKEEKLVLDWRKYQQYRAAVRVTIKRELDNSLPVAYTKEMYERTCLAVYDHVYEAYYGEGRSLYVWK